MIRLAVIADLPAIGACAEAAYAQYIPRIGRRPAPMDADYAALVEAGHVRVACDEAGAVLGFVAYWAEADHVYLDAVALLPAAAGRGLGRKLVACAEAAARATGLPEVRLYTNAMMTENLTLYPHLGYVQVDRRMDAGFDRVFYVKTV